MTACPLSICSGDGWFFVPDWTTAERERCPCNYDATPTDALTAMRAEVMADPDARAIYYETLARAARLDAEQEGHPQPNPRGPS